MLWAVANIRLVPARRNHTLDPETFKQTLETSHQNIKSLIEQLD